MIISHSRFTKALLLLIQVLVRSYVKVTLVRVLYKKHKWEGENYWFKASTYNCMCYSFLACFWSKVEIRMNLNVLGRCLPCWTLTLNFGDNFATYLTVWKSLICKIDIVQKIAQFFFLNNLVWFFPNPVMH